MNITLFQLDRPCEINWPLKQIRQKLRYQKDLQNLLKNRFLFPVNKYGAMSC